MPPSHHRIKIYVYIIGTRYLASNCSQRVSPNRATVHPEQQTTSGTSCAQGTQGKKPNRAEYQTEEQSVTTESPFKWLMCEPGLGVLEFVSVFCIFDCLFVFSVQYMNIFIHFLKFFLHCLFFPLN